MAQASSSKSVSSTGTKKKIRVHKHPSTTSSKSSSDEEQDSRIYLPPAARDSKWVGLTFYNPNFQFPGSDEETDEKEIQVMDIDDEEDLPIYALFPKLREKFPRKYSLTKKDKSTTDIIKSLVGEKPNFELMKRSKKIIPVKLSLPSLKENPNEERAEEEYNKNIANMSGLKNKSEVKPPKISSDEKAIKQASQPTVSCTTNERAAEEDSDSIIKIGTKRKRRTKRKKNIPIDLETESSYSGLNQSTKAPLKKQKLLHIFKSKQTDSTQRKNIKQQSSQGSLADEESV